MIVKKIDDVVMTTAEAVLVCGCRYATTHVHGVPCNLLACACVTEVPLQIVTPLQDQEVMEKQEAVFICEVSKPNQTAKWLRNGVDVIAAGRYDIKVDGTRHILTIKDAETADQAQYSVNFVDVSSAATLSVTGK